MSAETAHRVSDPYTAWSPIVSRPPLKWPGDARVALSVLVNIEYLEWLPPPGIQIPRSAVHRGPYPEVPDIHEVSPHEYGNRVGIFRVMDVLDGLGIPATVPIDGAAVARYPFLVEEIQRRGWEIAGHGATSSRVITQLMTESEERAYIRAALEPIRKVTGSIPAGWSGVEYSESDRTLALLAEFGVKYVCDWPNDEQPHRLSVPTGEMHVLPVAIELDEVYTHHLRGVPIHRWALMVREAFDRLYIDGSEAGRVLVLSLHPWIIGQPFRIRYLREALTAIIAHGGVWAATGKEVVDWAKGQGR